MRSMGAYTAKLNAENLGRTQKVQNDNHTVTTGIYRGVPRCTPEDFSLIFYNKSVKCSICYVKK